MEDELCGNCGGSGEVEVGVTCQDCDGDGVIEISDEA